jgi:hypothetical protein
VYKRGKPNKFYKPNFLRRLKIYYKSCNVRTSWAGDRLLMPGRVYFEQIFPDDGTYHVYIKVVYIGKEKSFEFPVEKMTDVLEGIKKFDGSLIYKVW